MTEKQFAGEFDNQYSGVYDNGKQLSNFEVVRLLNELAEENQRLKNDCSILVQSNQEYRKKNEQLKQLIKKTLETTPIEHTLAMELKNSVRELYD